MKTRTQISNAEFLRDMLSQQLSQNILFLNYGGEKATWLFFMQAFQITQQNLNRWTEQWNRFKRNLSFLPWAEDKVINCVLDFDRLWLPKNGVMNYYYSRISKFGNRTYSQFVLLPPNLLQPFQHFFIFSSVAGCKELSWLYVVPLVRYFSFSHSPVIKRVCFI